MIVRQAFTEIDGGVAPAITTAVAPGRELGRQSPPVIEQLDISGVVAEAAASASLRERDGSGLHLVQHAPGYACCITEPLRERKNRFIRAWRVVAMLVLFVLLFVANA